MEDNLKNRRILIIGGAGYIGSVLTRKLLAKGCKVSVLDNLIYDNSNALIDLMENENFSFLFGDFGNDSALETALNEITDVVLLAALVGEPICNKYPELARKTNTDYSKNLFRKLTGKNINRFIFTSTCSNYGLRPDDSIADEESELHPLSLYAETKIEFEEFILDNINNIDFSPTILRLSTAFGISGRTRFDLTITEFTKEMAFNKYLLVYDEDTWRPYCHVSDISEAIIKVLEAPEERVSGQVFNIGSEKNNYTKKMIVELIRKNFDNAKIEYKKGGTDPRNFRVSFEKANNILGFEAIFRPEDTINHLINSIENNLFKDTEARKNFYRNNEIVE